MHIYIYITPARKKCSVGSENVKKKRKRVHSGMNYLSLFFYVFSFFHIFKSVGSENVNKKEKESSFRNELSCLHVSKF
jgi:hypothetical protein